MEFAYLFGQWFCGPMRYASLPPALVRGVAKPGGVRQPHIFHKRVPRIRTANTESAFCLVLCCREFILPRYQCAHWYHPPHKCGGRGWLRRQCAKCQFAALNRYHVRNAARSKNRTGSINIEIYKICGRLSPAATNVSGEDYWFFTRSFSLMKIQVRIKPPIRETHQQPA